jgi:adenosyl cobinamide kinase/adenosyl cobinamide phosphate guanylyltransferase
MRIELVTGGARSGKSRWAQERALALGGRDVTVVVTARSGDPELDQRIARHRRDRPRSWRLREAPGDAGEAVRDAPTATVVLDCLTLLTANSLTQMAADAAAVEGAMLEATEALLTAASCRRGDLIVVTNEVGLSIHPPTNLGRWFQDGLGRCNQRVAAVADRLILMVCGVPVAIKGGLP